MTIQFQQVYNILCDSPWFSRLDEGEKNRLIQEFEVVSLQAGQYLFRQGRTADAFFQILEGKLTLTHQKNRRIVNEISLQRGDHLGEEAFIRGENYRSSALAKTNAILIRTKRGRLSDWIDRFPRLSGSRNLLASTVLLSKVVNLDWLNHDERVVLLNRKHPIFLIMRIFVPFLAILLGLVLLVLNLQEIITLPQLTMVGIAVLATVALLWIFWVSLDWANDYYILTTKRLVRVDRIVALFDRREEIPLGNILSVDVTATPLGKMFGFADITSRTYNVPVTWHGISNPDLVASMIQLQVERIKSIHAEMEMSAMQSAIDRQLGIPLSQLANTSDDSQTSKPVISGTYPITFRKHWVVLLRKTWFPFSFCLAGIFTLMGGFSEWFPQTMREMTSWFVGLAVIVFFIWYIYQLLDWRNDIYQLTSEQILDVKRKPLGREDRKTAPLENILSINYRRRGLLGLLLNYGTVTIQVGTENLIFDYVRDPSGVQRDIFRAIADRQAVLRQENLESERDHMSQWIAAYHRRINK